jgi:hypothetical protein
VIGTSDGEQFNTPLEHSIANSMPLGGSSEPAGALKQEGGYQGSGGELDRPLPDKSIDYNTLSKQHLMDPLGIEGHPYYSIDDWQKLRQQNDEPTSQQEKIPTSSLNPKIQQVLSQPHIAEALSNPKIDRTHEVPYVAGASAKPNDFTTHIDKSVPTTATVSGKTFDPAIPLNIHEQVEREVMENLKKRGMSNEKAYEIAHHEYAEPAEDHWYRSQGIDVGEVNKFWKGIDQKTEKDKGDFPPDLYKAPYPHDKVEGVKHEPSNVNQEWAMNMKNPPILTPDPTTTSHIGGVAPIHGGGATESIYSPAVLHEGAVHMGGEHGEAYRNAYKATGVRPIFKDTNQGYVTSKGRFVSRHEAVPIAEEAQQIIPTKDLTSMERKAREEFGLSSHELP